MMRIRIFLTFIVLCAAAISYANKISVCKDIFADKSNGALYWEGLVKIAKNNKAQALEIVKSIRLNSQEPHLFNWQKNVPENIDDFFDKFFVSSMARDPQTLSSLGIFESIGIHEHNAYLNNVSPEALLCNFKNKVESLKVLKSYALTELSDDQKISYKIFEWMLEHNAAGEKFIFYEYKINQLFGILSDLTVVFTEFHPLKFQEDIQTYIARLGRIPEQLDQAIALLEYQKNMGIVPPAFALEKAIAAIDASMPAQINEHIFYSHLADQINNIDVHNKDNFLEHAASVITLQVYPAYRKLQIYCRSLLEQAKTNNGVWALPDGDTYYDYMLKYHTTTDLSADQIHELGLNEVEKIQDQIRTILAGQGIVDNNQEVGQLIKEIEKDPRFYFPQTEQGRKDCLKQFEQILERCRKELYPLFDIKPKSPVKVLAVPTHQEEGMPGAYYYGPSIDGSRPGAFYANLRNMNELPKFRMETLAVHEAEPGHHFQISIQQEMDVPIMRKIGDLYTAYVEGWALYVEKLAYEQGFYSSPLDQLGHLQDELLRAVRLVVDTGIHKKRWSRDQAIEYMVRQLGWSQDSIITEVERYFVLPGQACAYKIGQLKILELRQKAKNALGDTFDIRAFHNVVLKLGMAPLTMLEQIVDDYIHASYNKKDK